MLEKALQGCLENWTLSWNRVRTDEASRGARKRRQRYGLKLTLSAIWWFDFTCAPKRLREEVLVDRLP
jgi:hypothetical protein